MAQASEFGQPLGQLDHRRMGRAGQHHVFDFAKLVDDGRIDTRVAVAEQIDPPARYGVEVAVSIHIDQPRALTARNRQWGCAFQLFHLRAGMPDRFARTRN